MSAEQPDGFLYPPPPDVIACGADPKRLYCEACIDAYRNGIEPLGTACDERQAKEEA